MCRRDDEPMGVVDCPACGGEGQIFTGMVGSRWSIDPPCETYRPCDECGGRGGVEGLPELVDEYDLDEMTPPLSAYETAVSEQKEAA